MRLSGAAAKAAQLAGQAQAILSTQGGSSDMSAAATSPAPSSVTAKKSKSGTAVIKWAKSTGASGYEVWIAPKGGKFTKTATITDSSKLSYTKTGLSSGKIYNVKVRSYVTVNNKKVYSPYSKTVTVKV